MAALTEKMGAQDYETKTRGLKRHQPGARVLAEGVYTLYKKKSHYKESTRLAYKLEVPHACSAKIARLFKLPSQASYTLSVKNPLNKPAGRPSVGGHPEESYTKEQLAAFDVRADTPRRVDSGEGSSTPRAAAARPLCCSSALRCCVPLTTAAQGYAWISCADPTLLDVPRAELLLIGARYTEPPEAEVGGAQELERLAEAQSRLMSAEQLEAEVGAGLDVGPAKTGKLNAGDAAAEEEEEEEGGGGEEEAEEEAPAKRRKKAVAA